MDRVAVMSSISRHGHGPAEDADASNLRVLPGMHGSFRAAKQQQESERRKVSTCTSRQGDMGGAADEGGGGKVGIGDRDRGRECCVCLCEWYVCLCLCVCRDYIATSGMG